MPCRGERAACTEMGYPPRRMRTPRRTLLPVPFLVFALLLTLWAGPATAGDRAERYREKLLGFVNDVRREHGIKALGELSGLSDLARDHTLSMARQRRLFHTNDLGKKVQAWRPSTWGENVGVGPSIWRIVQMWERSSEHYAIMVNRSYRRAGVSVVYARGAYWATLIVIS
jgi:uncharacterized protein YkwD